MSGAPDDAPLILTLRLDEAHQALFNRLREAHFPPDRNYLSAHVTLFHALPGERCSDISRHIADVASSTARPEVAVGQPYSLGRGVAFRLSSLEIEALRADLAAEWSDWLTAQDRAKRGLHVTVQNKAAPADARLLLDELSAGFAPSRFLSPGLDLWRYRGGPWEAAGRFAFANG